MRYTLIKKEIRQLLPIAILLILFFTAQLIYEPFSGRLDEKSWSVICEYLEPDIPFPISLFLMILCLMTAYALFPREHDDRTIDYLYSLPVSRNAVFLSKFIAALLILCGSLMLGCLTEWLLQLFNSQPYTGDQFNLRTAITAYFLMAAFNFIMLSHGLLLSFFRRFGLLLLGMIWVFISSFKDKLPFLEYLNILNVAKMEYYGQTLLVPWKLIFINTSIGIISLLIAGFLWTTPAEQFSMWYQQFFKKRIGTIIGIATSIAVLIFFVTIVDRLMKDEVEKDLMKGQYASFQTATFSTEHYNLTYPQNLRKTAHELIGRADEVYVRTRDFLSAQDSGPIAADLTEQSNEHDGIAALYKIRMDIRKTKKLEDRLRIFAHETTHVFAILESNRKINDYWNSTLFFNEGLAEYVSYALYPDEERLEAKNLISAITWKRNKITFDDLADMASFNKKYSEALVYTLGHLWVKAISNTYGDKALSDILRALGREGAPTNLGSHLLWQDTLQAIDCDLEKINATWIKLLNDLSIKYEKRIEALPRLSGGVVGKEKGETILSAVLDRDLPQENLQFIVRYRKDSSVKHEDTHMIYGQIQWNKEPIEIRFSIPSFHLVGRRFEYQFGYIINQGDFPYFEEWQSGEN
ncbi:MAG: ABC transporter permease subunit [Deltaproteobacteria bacterium]|nr:ABC transporter permease subunit [Deltaproteobacteria bacterium]